MHKSIGAHYLGNNQCQFSVWAPFAQSIKVFLPEKDKAIHLKHKEKGYWSNTLNEVNPGTRYFFEIDQGKLRPDPASFSQPDGVHEASEVVDPNAFEWSDNNWGNIPLEDMIQYELHVGAFSPEGTFEGVEQKLDYLLEVGINTIELMPVGQFPGERNWGYDGVFPFAVQNSYGGPQGLKKLVNACHKKGIAVILDVIYNHLGPEGNYLRDYGPYFTDKYRTPWGEALNFDEHHSDEVRNYFIQNALMWFRDFHIDGLRLDAVHAILDMSAKPFLRELAEEVEKLSQDIGKPCYLIPESDLNDVKLIRSQKKYGFGLDAQWLDDFHHALHALMTGEEQGYYQDFGHLEDLVKAMNKSFVYDWKYSEFRKKYFGSDASKFPGKQFIIFSQNHDQVGNRLKGDRLSQLLSFEELKLIAGIEILAPYVPMLFMGEEFGADTPFQYFISHHDPKLVEAVRNGRKQEFKAFNWKGTPPDPADPETFNRCKLDWNFRKDQQKQALFEFYKTLIRFRKNHPALQKPGKTNTNAYILEENVMVLERGEEENKVVALFNFGKEEKIVKFPVEGNFTLALNSASSEWMGNEEPGHFPGEIDGKEVIQLKSKNFYLFTKTKAI